LEVLSSGEIDFELQSVHVRLWINSPPINSATHATTDRKDEPFLSLNVFTRRENACLVVNKLLL